MVDEVNTQALNKQQLEQMIEQTLRASSQQDEQPVDDDEGKKKYKEMRFAAMNLLARREYSRGELTDKLQRRFELPALAELVLDQLIEDGLQSDQRFTESFVNSRVNRGHGLFRIRQELRQKKLASHLLEELLSELSIDWFAVAADCYQRKFGDSKIIDQKDYAKRARFMAYRGHNSGDITELLAAFR
ncbi:Regulatory protein RecX [Sinobacterium norvegicum]|uniref:Regulatory protein RecX n=1 Tax=Sinobacterium norvegicum TaxID=1641715 RepID=A0ABN8EFZ4_9GAMM|nr:regulatory protein RecX [Sinobacterium norvegicum]CAH0990578.1 Regulatory protein RecX [Sinobacterium norvegicum]